MQYRRELDGLRALAVIPIVLLHAGFKHFSGGWVGVDVFFVLSGYLITSIVIAEKQSNTFSLLHFYGRRARRILPALLVMLAISCALAWVCLLPPDMDVFCHSVASVLGFYGNVFFSEKTNYFGIAAPLTPLVHTWSLAVEEQFYILFPALVVVLWRWGERAIGVVCGVMALGSLLLAQHYAQADTQFDFYELPTRAWEILAGALIAAYTPRLSLGGVSPRIREWAAVLGIGLIVYAIFAFDDATRSPGLPGLIPISGAVLVIVFATETTVAGRLLSWTPLVSIGAISYSLYLFHQPVFAFARQGLLAEPDPLMVIGLLAATVAMSYASWCFIEQPFRDRKSVSWPVFFTVGAVVVVLLLAVSIGGWRTLGYTGRFDSKEHHNQQVVKALGAERGQAVRGDVCQFNNVKKLGLEGFLKQWNCIDDRAQPNLKRIPLIVTGDSHSADVVIALKLNGVIPLQIGGAGCSIVPSRMSNNCERIFRQLHDTVAHDSYYQYLALAQRFSDRDLTPGAVRETLEYWKTFNKELIWFAALPTFYVLGAHVERGQLASMDVRLSELSERGAVRQILQDAAVEVVDTEDLFCSLNHCSYLSAEGCLLLVEDSHLSLWGAQLFGRALLEREPTFAQWASAGGAVPPPQDPKLCHKPMV